MLTPLQGTLAPVTLAAKPFSPRSLSPYLWLDAGAGVEVTTGNPAADTNTVQRWLDRSGNNAHAVQNASGNRMTYRSSVVTGNADGSNRSMPILRGSASTIMLGVLASAVSNAALSIFAVVAVSGSTRHTFFGLEPSAGAGNSFSNLEWALWADFTPNRMTTFQNPGSGSSAAQINVLSSPVTGFNVHSVNLNGTAIQSFINNTSQGSSTGAGSVSRSNYVVGARATNTSPLVGDIAEVLVFPLLSTADRGKVARYLGAKYNIAVS